MMRIVGGNHDPDLAGEIQDVWVAMWWANEVEVRRAAARGDEAPSGAFGAFALQLWLNCFP